MLRRQGGAHVAASFGNGASVVMDVPESRPRHVPVAEDGPGSTAAPQAALVQESSPAVASSVPSASSEPRL